MSLSDKPVIGVTGPNKGGRMAWFFTALSIRLSGGIPIRVTPAKPVPIDVLDGLVIGGGADVDPETYSQNKLIEEYLKNTLQEQRIPWYQKLSRAVSWLYYPFLFILRKLLSRKGGHGLDKARDQLEFKLVDEAWNRKIPMLGICRGSQLLNVFFKGSLYQNLNSFYTEKPNPHSVFPVKQVYIMPNTNLQHILQATRLEVNALHYQAVKKTGEGIKVSARENNSVIQAIESEDRFIIGVQWHPELLPHITSHRRIFQALVEYAKRKIGMDKISV